MANLIQGDQPVLLSKRQWGRRAALVLGGFLLLVMLGWAGSNLHILTRLARAERRWKEKAPAHYSYTIETVTMDRRYWFTPWTIEVDRSRVIAVKQASSGEPVVPFGPGGWVQDSPGPKTIDQLFHWIRTMELDGYYDAYLSKAWDNSLVFICRLDIPRLSRWACERTCKTRVPRWVRIDYDAEWGYPIRLVVHYGGPGGCWTAYKRKGGRNPVIFEISDFRPLP